MTSHSSLSLTDTLTQDTMLSCTKCGVVQLDELFDRNCSATKRRGRHHWCKACRVASWKARYKKDPVKYQEFARWGAVKHRFGLSKSQYEEMMNEQDGVCAICKKPEHDRRLCIDHDHSCCPGEKSCGDCIRRLVCSRCNRLIGIANDDPDILLAAVQYLRSYS